MRCYPLADADSSTECPVTKKKPPLRGASSFAAVVQSRRQIDPGAKAPGFESRITQSGISPLPCPSAAVHQRPGLKFPRTLQALGLIRPPSLTHRMKAPHGSKDARQGIFSRSPSCQGGARSLLSSSFQPTRLSPATQPHRQTLANLGMLSKDCSLPLTPAVGL